MPAPMMMITSVPSRGTDGTASDSAAQWRTCVDRPHRCPVHVARELLDPLERRAGQDAVSQVENMSRASVRPLQDLVRGAEHAIRRTEKQGRIEVALHAAIVSDLFPRFVE